MPLTAIAVTLVVLVSAAFAVPAVRDAATLADVPDFQLSYSAGYLLIAPLSAILDTLTLFTVRQHAMLLVWALALYVVYRVWRGRPRPRALHRVAYEAAYAGAFLAVVLGVYAYGAVGPRPMAELTIPEAARMEVLVIDFHSHTRYSHDGRPGWEPSDVRAWHRAAGFDADYITDHATVAGAERGIADNPTEAGEGTMLLQGIEAFYNGEHVNVLGAGRRYKGLLTPDSRDVDPQALMLASLVPRSEPVLIETLPGNMKKMIAAGGPGTAGVRAIEIIDGAPRGLAQTRRDREQIVRLADSLDLALVAGSDNHGWGKTAPGWTLMDIPGWRGMSSDSLAAAIERSLRTQRRRATRVVERRIAGPDGNAVATVFAPPLAAWEMLTTLSPDERVMWIIWAWAIAIGLRARRIRRRTARA